MALTIDHPEADRLVRELAALTGETPGDAAVQALRERLDRVQRRSTSGDLAATLREIGRRCASLPAMEPRRQDEFLG